MPSETAGSDFWVVEPEGTRVLGDIWKLIEVSNGTLLTFGREVFEGNWL